jgi:hypothetical protein
VATQKRSRCDVVKTRRFETIHINKKGKGIQILCSQGKDSMRCFYIVPRTVRRELTIKHQVEACTEPARESSSVRLIYPHPVPVSLVSLGVVASPSLDMLLPANTSRVALGSEGWISFGMDQSSITLNPAPVLPCFTYAPNTPNETFWFGINSWKPRCTVE